MQWSAGRNNPDGTVKDPDGYSTLYASNTTGGTSPWNNAITVWRNNSYTPQFDPAYIYTLSPLGASSLVLDAESGYLTDASQSSMLATSQFLITANGSYWHHRDDERPHHVHRRQRGRRLHDGARQRLRQHEGFTELELHAAADPGWRLPDSDSRHGQPLPPRQERQQLGECWF